MAPHQLSHKKRHKRIQKDILQKSWEHPRTSFRHHRAAGLRSGHGLGPQRRHLGPRRWQRSGRAERGGARGPGKGGGWWRGGGSLVYLGEVDRWVNLLQLKVRFQGFTSWGIGPRLTDSVLRASHPHRSSFLRP